METDEPNHQGKSGNTEKHKQSKNASNKKKRLELDIREMEIDDIPEVFHLGEQIFTVEMVPTLYRTWDEYEVTSLFNSDPEYCLVAELDDRIVGFALGTTVTKTKSPWKYGYLVWLGVLPEWHREGIGSRLFDKLAEEMSKDGARIFLVDTEANNLPALQFFRKKGFGNPEERIFLTLNLKTHRQLQRKTRGSGRKAQDGNLS